MLLKAVFGGKLTSLNAYIRKEQRSKCLWTYNYITLIISSPKDLRDYLILSLKKNLFDRRFNQLRKKNLGKQYLMFILNVIFTNLFKMVLK